MKTLLMTARNHTLHLLEVDGEDKLIPATEVVLTLTEPKYAQTENGIAKYPEYETVRFTCVPSSLRAMSKSLAEYADECDRAFGQIAAIINPDDDEEDLPLFDHPKPGPQPATEGDPVKPEPFPVPERLAKAAQSD